MYIFIRQCTVYCALPAGLSPYWWKILCREWHIQLDQRDWKKKSTLQCFVRLLCTVSLYGHSFYIHAPLYIYKHSSEPLIAKHNVTHKDRGGVRRHLNGKCLGAFSITFFRPIPVLRLGLSLSHRRQVGEYYLCISKRDKDRNPNSPQYEPCAAFRTVPP